MKIVEKRKSKEVYDNPIGAYYICLIEITLLDKEPAHVINPSLRQAIRKE